MADRASRSRVQELERRYEARKVQTNAVENLIGKLDRWGKERHAARERAFLEGEVQPATPSPAALAEERARLRGMMADANSAYWKGDEAEGLQERYRQLVADSGPAEA